MRIALNALHTVRLAHVLSELDSDAMTPPVRGAGATVTSISGITEWASATSPAVSLGWDWRVLNATREVRYERSGLIRSNLMLLDSRGRDLGTVGTGIALRVVVDALPWQEVVHDYITNCYGCHLSNITVTENPSSY